ncbi:hypothetical protein, partial [Escherichia coli]
AIHVISAFSTMHSLV